MNEQEEDFLAKALADRLISRRDVKAIQHPSGNYEPERSKWTMGDLRSHLRGKRTYGHYMVDQGDKTKLFAFDIDLFQVKPSKPEASKLAMTGQRNEKGHDVWVECDPRTAWREGQHREWFTFVLHHTARQIVETLLELLEDTPVAVAYSGSKGLHVYCYTGPCTAKEAREAAMLTLNVLDIGVFRGTNFFRASETDPLEIEVYPKQDSIAGKDLGNLMRLPLGRHQKGGRGFFVDITKPLEYGSPFVEIDPKEGLAGVTAL